MIPFDDPTLTYSIAFTFQDYDRLEIPAKKFIEYIFENVKDSKDRMASAAEGGKTICTAFLL